VILRGLKEIRVKLKKKKITTIFDREP